jgi:hypothetical protein
MPKAHMNWKDMSEVLKKNLEQGKKLLEVLERKGELPKPKPISRAPKPQSLRKKRARRRHKGKHEDREWPYRPTSREIPSGLPGSGRNS